MQILLKLNEPLGADLGPFSLTTNIGSVSPSTASRNDILNGIIVTVDDSVTSIIVTSNSSSGCPNISTTINITGIPEPECDCEFYNLTVSNQDILDATGNIGILSQYNNVVVYRYTDCNNILRELLAPDAGTFNNVICVKDMTLISITYYKNNTELAGLSFASETGIPCC